MYTLTSIADGGAHGTVYKGKDHLNRDFAIKFIRPTVGDRTFVMGQAKALARVNCSNVVAIHSIEDVVDPDSGEPTPAIIMPWLEGKTFDHILKGPTPTPEELKRIGIGMIMGMKSIHAAGLSHGDFHFRNVMVGDDFVKIIDILYHNTLANEVVEAKEIKLQSDRNSLRSLLADLLTRVKVDLADEFSRSLTPESSLDDIHIAFSDVTNPRVEIDINEKVDEALSRVSDPAFVCSIEYADALSDEVHPKVIPPLLKAIIIKGIVEFKHATFLGVLWNRMTPEDQQRICVDLAAAINREVPKGNWTPHLITLHAFGARTWDLLTRATTIRLENAMSSDLGEGRFEAGGVGLQSGALGTWVRLFYPQFKDQATVRQILLSKLKGSWSSQNYLGNYFMAFIALAADGAGERKVFVEAFAKAVRDNAWTVINNLDKLPEEWRTEIGAA